MNPLSISDVVLSSVGMVHGRADEAGKLNSMCRRRRCCGR
jgi:hypothetical protein